MTANYSRLLPGIPQIESPLFPAFLAEAQLSQTEREIAIQLNERGYAVIDFPDKYLEEKINNITADLAPRFGMKSVGDTQNCGSGCRIQDAWQFNDDVRRIAANSEILGLLSKLYGRRAIPFQTLNFPTGTQQHMHTDSVHFSSIPPRFMCGVWLAFEDIREEAGPLIYYPGSHKWPLLSNDAIGMRAEENLGGSAQAPFEAIWRTIVGLNGLHSEKFLAKKGQCVIWVANLLHGGLVRSDLTLTRWSQVTHYYFEDCIYYTPAYSNEAVGNLDMRTITNIENGAMVPNKYLGREAPPAKMASANKSWLHSLLRAIRVAPSAGLPSDFDENRYYQLNSDVADANVDAGQHYLKFGIKEGRRYR